MIGRPALPLVLLFLLGCSGLFGGKEDPADDGDRDGDGYDAPADCDDANPDAHPGAEEMCDDANADEDCDGLSDDDDENPGDRHHWYPDADGDGHGEEDGDSSFSCDPPAGYVQGGDDCDDAEPSVNPDAPEICDGLDNDCDRGTDDADPQGADGAPATFLDADGDGYGDPATEAHVCADAGRVATGGDCDDRDRDVNPGVEEVCDPRDVDEDCDGYADDADPDLDRTDLPTWYEDADGDGYGADDAPFVGCEAPSGHVAEAGDCDDDDDGVNPGASEVCEDGKDNDCDGTSNTCALTGSHRASTIETGKIRGSRASEYVGEYEIGSVGDLDGDGADDLAFTSNPSGSGLGVRIFQRAVTSTVASSSAEVTLTQASGGAGYFGSAFAGGDFDGDGARDIAVGDPQFTTGSGSAQGVVYLFDGPVTASATGDDADRTLAGASSNAQLGSMLARGDNDGDGDDDLYVGGSFNSPFFYIFDGPIPAGESTTDDRTAYVYGMYTALDLAVGDVDADGFDDVVTGAWVWNDYAGAVYVAHGPITADVQLSDITSEELEGGATTGYFGESVAVGDLTGDGYADLILTEPRYSTTGMVYLVEGPPPDGDIFSVAVARYSGSSGAYMAQSVCTVDFDGDGALDLGIGSTGDDSSYSNAGAVGLFYGPSFASGSLSDADLLIEGESSSYGLGAKCAGGDLDGDGYGDLVAGAPQDSDGGSRAGAAWIFGGSGL